MHKFLLVDSSFVVDNNPFQLLPVSPPIFIKLDLKILLSGAPLSYFLTFNLHFKLIILFTGQVVLLTEVTSDFALDIAKFEAAASLDLNERELLVLFGNTGIPDMEHAV